MATGKLRSLNNQKASKLFETLVDGVLKDSSDFVFKTEKSVQAFGRYSIIESENIYKIYKNKVLASESSSYKCALAWCIANKYNIKSLQDDINLLQKQLQWKQSEIEFLKYTFNQDIGSDRKYIIEDKLQIAVIKARHFKEQLNKCIERAKYIQQKGFNNETSRFGINSRGR